MWCLNVFCLSFMFVSCFSKSDKSDILVKKPCSFVLEIFSSALTMIFSFHFFFFSVLFFPLQTGSSYKFLRALEKHFLDRNVSGETREEFSTFCFHATINDVFLESITGMNHLLACAIIIFKLNEELLESRN